MSEFSPLRDPVFVLVWQVHLLVVSLFALLGIWAGVTRRSWYIAPTLFLALLWLFVPLEAPEPAVVLLLSVPILAVACRIARRWLEKPLDEESVSREQPRWRFSLADLLWLTLLVGMLTGLSMQVWRLPWEIHWPDVAVSTVSFCLIGIAVFATNRQITWKRRSLASFGVVALVIGAGIVHQAFVHNDWLLLRDWEAFALPLFPFGSQSLLSIYLLAFAEFVLLMAIGVESLWPNFFKKLPPLLVGLRVAAGCLILAIVAGLPLTYTQVLERLDWPVERWPETNDREAFWSVLVRQRQLNPGDQSLDELHVKSAPRAQSVEQLIAELDDLLLHDNITQFDSRHDNPAAAFAALNLTSVQSARSMARVLVAQARADWKAGRRRESLQQDLRCLKLAQVFQRRCISLDVLVGMALEGMALNHLAEIRTELDCAEIQEIESFLAGITAAREPVELLLARDQKYDEEAFGWRERLSRAARRFAGKQVEHEQRLVYSFSNRDAHLQLLRTDLAIRCYQKTHSRWPETLSDLVPQSLPAVPLDPFSRQPLVYRVVDDDDFLLYSVGANAVDDGGKFGSTRVLFESGYDLDLDTWSRDY